MVQQATKVAPVTPKGNGQGQVTLDVPEGMTPEQYKKFIHTWEVNRDKGQKIARADGKALRRLIKTHKPEFQQFRIQEWKAEGLDSSKLKV